MLYLERTLLFKYSCLEISLTGVGIYDTFFKQKLDFRMNSQTFEGKLLL